MSITQRQFSIFASIVHQRHFSISRRRKSLNANNWLQLMSPNLRNAYDTPNTVNLTPTQKTRSLKSAERPSKEPVMAAFHPKDRRDSFAPKARPKTLPRTHPPQFLNAADRAPDRSLILAVPAREDARFDCGPVCLRTDTGARSIYGAHPGSSKQRMLGLITCAIHRSGSFLRRYSCRRGFRSWKISRPQFAQNPDVSGHVWPMLLADGIHSPRLSFFEAKAMIEAGMRSIILKKTKSDVNNLRLCGLYGWQHGLCAAAAIADRDLMNDLPAYGWLEDLDFGVARCPVERDDECFFRRAIWHAQGRETNGSCGLQPDREPLLPLPQRLDQSGHALITASSRLFGQCRGNPCGQSLGIDRSARLRGNLMWGW